MDLKPTRPEVCEDDAFFEDEPVIDTKNALTIKEEFDALHYPLSSYQLEELQSKADFLRSQKMNIDGRVSSFFIATKIMGWEIAGNTYWLDDGSPVGDVLTFNPMSNDFQTKLICKTLGLNYPGNPSDACIDILDWYKISGKSILTVQREQLQAQRLAEPNAHRPSFDSYTLTRNHRYLYS